MMDFPIARVIDEQACYDWLVELLHPNGLGCPRGHPVSMAGVHKRHRAPVLVYQCNGVNCRAVYTAFTGTMWRNSRWRPSEIIQLLQGTSQGKSSAQIAREIGRHRCHVMTKRKQLQGNAYKALPASPPARSRLRSRRGISERGRERHTPSRS